MNTKQRIAVICTLITVASCSESKVDNLVTEDTKTVIANVAPITKVTLDQKVTLSIQESNHLQFSIKNISDKPLMAIKIKSIDGSQSLQHVFANGNLLPGTSRMVTRKDLVNHNGSQWLIDNLAFESIKQG